MERQRNGLVLTLATALLLLAVASPADAFWPSMWGDTYRACEEGRQHNAMWPYPYVCPDRVRAQAPFAVMVTNGWRRQNLLGSHHFDAETGKLTDAGKLKVRWILTQAPQQRRQVFVERSIDPEVTSKRIEVAKQFATTATYDGSEPIVMDTHLYSEGRSAATVDLVQNSFRESMPPPVLPAGSTSTAASSN